ncbi:MAG: response regulator [Gammaproteobacteria bacterium]|nr:response regulator [Gammaproteobacteria bacterium]
MESKQESLKIMVIDDSNTIRSSAEKLLTDMGHQVSLAENGYEALSRIVDLKPDVIFLDIMMPKLDGYQTCALVKHNQDFKDIPIIMLSSKDGVYDKAKARVVGANDFISKPFTAEDLATAIKNIKYKI